ncbi:Probable RNA-binding protein 46 [Eumeta japonica]|uniref:Probable RNA-binding protein 46 n=1 Tax=Eumeta variegata TaxID=151549 RepID=A0A4C1UTS6_EUMVA|nr:Probable RNA-binding protein 46 [Eumeta japonica]
MNQGKQYSLSQVNLRELSSRLLSLTENTSYTLTQINGQRIYRKTVEAWNAPEPSRDCEVFVGRIPHDCFEDTLVPLLMLAGDLFEFRLMINFSGWNRGYAFAMYTSLDGAMNAVRMLDNYMIRPSWMLGVCPSVNNCRLFISRISPTLSSDEIVMILYDLTEEVKEVRIRRTSSSCSAIVEYKSHRGAAMARKGLVSMATTAWGAGARPLIDWSQPESPKQLQKYREIGTWSPERGLQVFRIPDNPTVTSNGHATPSYTLEPWCQARRLRLIQEAEPSTPTPGYDAALPYPSETAQYNSKPNTSWKIVNIGNTNKNNWGGLGLDPAERSVWAPPAQNLNYPPVNQFNPWTARLPLDLDSVGPHSNNS